MATFYFFVVLLVRVVLPAGLLLSIALRPFGLSMVYVLLFLISPLVQIPTTKTLSGWRGKYLILVMILSCLLLIVHIAWHITLASFAPYGKLLTKFPLLERICHNLGFVAYIKTPTLMIIHYLAPELVMTGTSVLVHLAVKRLLTRGTLDEKDPKYQQFPLLTTAGKYLCLFLIMFSGIMRPSITSGIYFLIFMGAATAWSLGKPLEKGFAVVGRCLMGIMILHIMVLIVYQCNYINELYPPEQSFARYFGLTQLVSLNSSTPYIFHYDTRATDHWATLASPVVILFTYYVLAIETRELFKPKAKQKSALPGLEAGKLNGSLAIGVSFHRGSRHATREKWKSATKKVRVSQLIRSSSPSKRWSSMRTTSITRQLHQDSTGSVVVGDDSLEDLNDEPTLLDDIIAAIVDFFQVIVRSSYIATTITMMAWSIMFHSWVTFVFLMWANIVWLCQDQRSFMLKTSPVLVIYAMLLLIAQYIYGMNLTTDELPSNVTDVNLQQIGLGRIESGEPCVPLLIKSLFTCMFWVTLRQRVQELRQRRQSATAADMAAPLQLTVSTAATAMEVQKEEESKSRLLRALGQFLRSACARYWIYVVVIMLFVIGITGDRMTIFRIIYMFLFLAFILMFQISWYWWRRLMYVFWIVVIIYSMINLILIYVYQFDNFSKAIEKYLLINERLQHDLGLEPYHPADLFVKLLTPTCFLIITIMQVHYFHKDFMELSDPRQSQSKSVVTPSDKQSVGGASTMKDDLPQLPLEDEPHRHLAGDEGATATEVDNSLVTSMSKKSQSGALSKSHLKLSRSTRQLGFRGWIALHFNIGRKHFAVAKDKVMVFLDIHLIKIIFLSLMLLCVFNVCALHVPIMILIAPALLLDRQKQRGCMLIISTIISIYFMAKMVYQIDYIKHSIFDVNCTIEDVNSTNITTFNNAEWIGFQKASRDRPLVVLLKGYIALIALFTFYSLVTYHQRNRVNRDASDNSNNPNLMFPDVKRSDADKNLIYCTKYLFNYGFYKFGVEISLICLMGVIGSRMDLYALIYAGWLLILVSIKRPLQAKVWKPFTGFTMVMVPLQYLLAVGFLPGFCIQYPWAGTNPQLKHVRNWLYLPYEAEPPHGSKLIFDYFLLLFASRQLIVFRIENANGDNYPGGSNKEDIGHDWETPNFVNPVPDFLGFVGTWLDVIKRLVFLGMLWVTLAIMFMTGTNRVNLFSMGYLVGSFIFLWQGTDFYLLPKDAILRWWSWLLRYNVSVVVIKTLLQIPGCMFSSVMQEHACWLVQLLGIGCVDKFAGGNIAQFLKMSYVKVTGQIQALDATCSVPQEDIGLAWDGVCFAFLILQRRLFLSYYFYRVIDDSKATTVLASRGAELIEQLRLKQMKIQEDQESKILEKIKVKMERIKANQRKIQGALAKEPKHHDRGSESSPGARRRIYTKRHEAVRSGDYYMFDEFDDVDELKEGPEKADSDDEAPKEMGLGKLLSTVMKTDLRRAMELRRASAPNVQTSRQHSLGSHPHSYAYEGHRSRSHLPQDPGGPSKDLPGQPSDYPEPLSLEDFPLEQETWFDKLHHIMEAVWAFISSFLVTMTRHLMRHSRDYRYVSRTLTLEKKVLKEKEGFGIGLREGSQMRWEPLPETLLSRDVDNHDGNLLVPIMDFGRKLSEISVPEIRILAPSMERGLDESPPSRRHSGHSPSSDTISDDDDDTSEHESAFSMESTESKDVTVLEEQDDSMFKQQKSVIIHLVYAIWFAVLAHTDIVCYIMVFINQIQSATILSIPLPLMVFLWGTLTIPRPSKTFWVTLIAYTEVIVLIKSMFQFEILPWNQKVIPANMPFTAPRIIGIERKSNYALYDLLLLLIIFLHRFMLKSLGLWKETSPDIELRVDKEYDLQPDDIQNLVVGRRAEVGKKYIKLNDRSGPDEDTGDVDNETPSSSRPHSKSGVRSNNVEIPSGSGLQDVKGNMRKKDGPNENKDGEPSKSVETDDDHYEVDDDQEPIIAVTTTLEDTYDNYPRVIWLSLKRYLQPTQNFFMCMLAPGARVTADIYAYMFLCDFFNFLVVIFGFAAFGTHQGDGGVQAYLEENKVPIPFLVMLILQFALIVIDRALYLRKFMLGKILFQYALIIGVHIWMFFVLPFITERTFNTLLPPPMWYMVKCIYLLLSAYQIRCGYPRRIIGNFLCKSYRFVNMVLFRGFMAVPFVFELRTLMDWIWTDTSMTLMDWLKMEDIFANIFLLKCSRAIEDEFPQPRGSKKTTTSKYLLGGSVLAFVIAIIWFPLVFFAFGNTVGEPNPPTDVTAKIRIGPFLPVYQMSAQSHNIEVYTEQDYTQLSNMYARDRTAQTFLSNYMYNDVAVVTLNSNSTMKWEISPPELDRLELEAKSNKSIKIKFTFVITHPSNTVQNPPTIEDSREVEMEPFVDAERTIRNPERVKLYAMLTNTSSPDSWVQVDLLFPKFLKVFNKGTAKPAYQLTEGHDDDSFAVDDKRLYHNVQLRLERDRDSMYWRVREGCNLKPPQDRINSIPMNNCDQLVMFTFNDKLFPETLNFISGSGIIGLYTTFVFLASRVIRGFFSGIYTKIMFDDLPNVDRVLQLCLDIYLVREALELALEEDLFAKLVFLYRSPETLIKWSRPKEEEEQGTLASPR
ncbi:piezo-type mechanosensitive ion channel component isoform X3 [Hyposmocoma kahamanoa]|uniref:piezo-type mechanosensitive ion channel component isoform X3 n=1 Tax=Hyposmocoma kahamanoa TaxID=1477025 RepID=UPI000E6D9644|nr:piezo-type mechanosensitive ion channel component isoform X3 [Hyposmocoma kahamanoa]